MGTILQYNDTNVTNNVTYYYRVSAVNKIGQGPLSNEIVITPKARFVQVFDSDGDGIPDTWEQFYGFNISNPNDAYLDFDSDNLTNLAEYLNNTDPRNKDTDSDNLTDGQELLVYNTDPTKKDSDDDGLIDGDEVKIYMTNATNPDSDGDGYSDGDEVKNNTDPLNENDYPGAGAKSKKSKPNNKVLYPSIIAIELVVMFLIILLLLKKKKILGFGRR
jgi:hypothetical protein